MEDLNGTLILAATGMITVFVILGLVVLMGNLLIGFVNKYLPAAVVQRAISAASLDPRKIAAITAAIDTLTGGKGTITDIKKSDN